MFTESFRLSAATPHLHSDFNFTESRVETVGPALRHSCRSELHVLPRFPVAQTIRSPDHDELSRPHRCWKSGPACYGFVRHPGISPLSRYGDPKSLRILPSVLPVTSLQETSCGFHRFEPVRWNGVATAPGNVTYPTRNFARAYVIDS